MFCPECGSSVKENAAFCGKCGAPAPATTIAQTPSLRSSSRPVVVVGLLLLVVCAFTIWWLFVKPAVPKPFVEQQASQPSLEQRKARQKEAMGIVRSVATACQAYAKDNGHFPDTAQFGHFPWVEVSCLSSIISPDYIHQVWAADPWGHVYWYTISKDKQSFAILCAGSDGIVQTSHIPSGHRGTQCLEDDIIWLNDQFQQCPEGPQRACPPEELGPAAQGFPAVAGKIFP